MLRCSVLIGPICGRRAAETCCKYRQLSGGVSLAADGMLIYERSAEPREPAARPPLVQRSDPPRHEALRAGAFLKVQTLSSSHAV